MGAPYVIAPYDLRVPGAFSDLESFRRWTRSETFPESGRIDWIAGEVEIDMSPERINAHGTLKVAIVGDLRTLVEGNDLGVVLTDRTRVSVPQADLSVEPDVVVVLRESVDAGRLRLVPAVGDGGDDFVEIEGPPDVIVECVSPSSRTKDWTRLREHYHRAGVPEYWIADALKGPARLAILRPGREGYEESPVDADGFAPSERLGRSFRLVTLPPLAGLVRYRLESR